MKNSIGIESIVFVREATPARAPRGAALGHLGRGRDDDLLRRPDHEPHVEPHQRAEHATEEDLPAVRGGEEATHAPVLREHHVQHVEPARDERDHGAPPEPPQRAVDEAAGDHPGPDRRLGLGEERCLHEVEVVQHADPGDAGEKM
jgi:hypothetical protein